MFSKTVIPKAVKYLNGWNLLITFCNDEKRVYNCDDIQNSNNIIFEPLKDINFFKKAYICPERSTLAWNDDIDCCPDSLYKESIPYHKWYQKNHKKS